MSSGFVSKKQKILRQLNVPTDEYTDASPKGSVDEPIRELVAEINDLPRLVTTSSCSGRAALYLEGRKSTTASHENLESVSNGAETEAGTEDGERPISASRGGKGGGQWLYVTHEPFHAGISLQTMINSSTDTETPFHTSTTDLAFSPDDRLVHFKFEAMILHILAADLDSAKKVLVAAQTAGFRESGIASISGAQGKDPDMVMVAVRSTGLTTDCPIGYFLEDSPDHIIALTVGETHVNGMIRLFNAKFVENILRTQKFRTNLLRQLEPKQHQDSNWEPTDVRKARLRAEGLERQARQAARETSSHNAQTEDADDESLDNATSTEDAAGIYNALRHQGLL